MKKCQRVIAMKVSLINAEGRFTQLCFTLTDLISVWMGRAN